MICEIENQIMEMKTIIRANIKHFSLPFPMATQHILHSALLNSSPTFSFSHTVFHLFLLAHCCYEKWWGLGVDRQYSVDKLHCGHNWMNIVYILFQPNLARPTKFSFMLWFFFRILRFEDFEHNCFLHCAKMLNTFYIMHTPT